jgi:hypothetical protein
MTDRSELPPSSWQHRVSQPRPRRRQHHAFARGTVTVGAIHMAGMLAGILAADKKPGDTFLEMLNDRIMCDMSLVSPWMEMDIDEKLIWIGSQERLKESGLVVGCSWKASYDPSGGGLYFIMSYRLDRARLEKHAGRTWEAVHPPLPPAPATY